MLDRILLFGTIVGGTAIGLLIPMHSTPHPATPHEITLAKDSDGQFYADADVDGHSTHFLVDTGASEIALSEADARAAGIQIDPTQYQLIGEGPSGIVRGQQIRIEHLDLGPIHQTDVKAVVVAGSSVSLLGQPFLDQLDQIVIKKGEMQLRYASPA